MKTPITYYGGKQNMLKYIIPYVPEHTTYIEPFAGGAALFFAKEPARLNVINDRNRELVNFYEISKTKHGELSALVQATVHSRSLHSDAIVIYHNPHLFDPVRRAWALWVLSKMSFCSKLGGTFGYEKKGNKTAKRIINAALFFDDTLQQKLEQTTIENEDALKVLERYDSEHAFHFVDPPYINTNQGHYGGYTEKDFVALLDILIGLKGKWMLTMYPAQVLDAYVKKHSWRVVEVEKTLAASKTRKKQVELMVMNYKV